MKVLQFSEHAAYLRIEAARASRRFPVILDLLAEGPIHLSAVSLLAFHLTEANHIEILDAARHQSNGRWSSRSRGCGLNRMSLQSSANFRLGAERRLFLVNVLTSDVQPTLNVITNWHALAK